MFMVNHLHGFNASAARVIEFPFISPGTDTLTGPTASSTSHAMTLPAASTGTMIYITGRSLDNNENPTITINTGSSGNNWTLATQTQNTNAMGFAAWKIAEGSDVLVLTTSSTNQLGALAFVIEDASTVTFATASAGATTSWNAPNCDPAVSKKYLWFAQYITTVLSNGTAPTDFTTYYNDEPSSGGGSVFNLHICEQDLEASSRDPAAVTNVSSGGGISLWTVAIHPP